eukprot:NODE_4586_length_789_cov_58.759459_g4245_i0.p1 GENE.NODE_4586_length_789_cov_58.759459_g4245_i0~~NODE_4586_length_789_cov_58.759459_g4245_i0.p1  ORF type:complete len:215 (-),score=46.21 NODE_4586_length_789_cov_58.759459_g4245_i0:87-731(-)
MADTAVGQWLNKHDLGKYVAAFAKEGYEDLEDVSADVVQQMITDPKHRALALTKLGLDSRRKRKKVSVTDHGDGAAASSRGPVDDAVSLKDQQSSVPSTPPSVAFPTATEFIFELPQSLVPLIEKGKVTVSIASEGGDVKIHAEAGAHQRQQQSPILAQAMATAQPAVLVTGVGSLQSVNLTVLRQLPAPPALTPQPRKEIPYGALSWRCLSVA